MVESCEASQEICLTSETIFQIAKPEIVYGVVLSISGSRLHIEILNRSRQLYTKIPDTTSSGGKVLQSVAIWILHVKSQGGSRLAVR